MAMKITKIVINKFSEFNKTGELRLKDCTLVNCAFLTTKELKCIMMALKFILSNEPFDNEYLESDMDDFPYIEMHVMRSQDDLLIFRKSLKQNEIVYEINGHEVSSDDFTKILAECSFKFSYAYITPNTIENLMNLDDSDRTKFIEESCGNMEIKKHFDKFSSLMEDYEVKMKFLNDSKKELNMDKKIEKDKIVNRKKIKDANEELEKEIENLNYTQLHNNESDYKFIKPEIIGKLIDQLPDVTRNYEEQLKNFKEIINQKSDFFERPNWMADQDFFEKVSQYLKHRKDVLLYENSLSIINYSEPVRCCIEEKNMKYDKEIQEKTSELEYLETHREKLKDSYLEYRMVLNEFFIMYPGFIEYVTSKYLMDKVKDLSNKLVKDNAKLSELTQIEKDYSEKLKGLYVEEQEIKKTLNDHQIEMNELFSEYKKIQITLKTSTAALMKQLAIIKSGKVEEDLTQLFNERFPGGALGILSELFNVKDVNGFTVNKSQIIERLGKHSNAIIVRSSDILEKCLDLLKSQQYDVKDVLLIPCYQYKEVATSLRSVKKLPKNVNIAKIENFLEVTDDEIKRILMHILKPTVVCDCNNLEGVKSVFEAFGKNVNVTSFAMDLTYRPKGLVDLHKRKKEERNVLQIAGEIFSGEMRSFDLKAILGEENLKAHQTKQKLIAIEAQSKLLNALLVQNKKHIDALSAKIHQGTQLKMKWSTEKWQDIQKIYDEAKEKYKAIVEMHFTAFCQKYDIPSYFTYAEICPKIFPEDVYQRTRKQILDEIKSFTQAKEKLLVFRSLYEDNNDRERVQYCIEKAKDSAENVHSQISAMIDQSKEKYTEWELEIENILHVEQQFIEAKSHMLKIFGDICYEQNAIYALMQKNYEILHKSLNNLEQISMTKGSLLSQLIFPEPNDIDEDFDLIRYHMDSVKIDYSTLSEELKNKSTFFDNIEKMEDTIFSLKSALKNFPLELEGDEEELEAINKKLKDLTNEIKSTNQECQGVLTKLKAITKDRKNRFNCCLDAINNEIKTYCKVVLEEKAFGELIPVNYDEPYLDGIRYYWRDGNEGWIDGKNRNCDAALAFLFGLLKYKQQRLCAYFFMSTELNIINPLYKYSSSLETDFQSILFWKTNVNEDNCHASILKFGDTLHIFDNEEEEKRLNKLLEDSDSESEAI